MYVKEKKEFNKNSDNKSRMYGKGDKSNTHQSECSKLGQGV